MTQERDQALVIALLNEVPTEWTSEAYDETDAYAESDHASFSSAFFTAQYSMTEPHVYTARIMLDTRDDDVEDVAKMLTKLKELFNRPFTQQSSHQFTLTYDMTVTQLQAFIDEHSCGCELFEAADDIIMSDFVGRIA
jgi:hypothetical protein